MPALAAFAHASNGPCRFHRNETWRGYKGLMNRLDQSVAGLVRAADASAAAGAHEATDAGAENPLHRLFGWAWRIALIGFLVALVSPPANAEAAMPAAASAAWFSVR